MDQKNIAILYICTGQYVTLWERFYETCEKYFLPKHKKTYFIWSDSKPKPFVDNIVFTYIKWFPSPHAMMNRYHHFMMRENDLKNYDYCFFFNSNVEFKGEVSDEVIPVDVPFCAAENIAQFCSDKESRLDIIKNKYWTNCPASPAFMSFEHWKQNPDFCWLMGGFNGGKAKDWIEMSKQIMQWVDYNKKHKLYLRWHDEPFMNKYMYEHGVLRLNPIHYLNWRKYTWKNDDVKIIVRKKQEILPTNFRTARTNVLSIKERLDSYAKKKHDSN